MEYRTLGDCGLKITPLTLGAMTFGSSTGFMKGVTVGSDAEGRRIFDRAIDAGINLVDTADVYSEGQSETLVGKWLEGKPHEILVATKCRFPMKQGGKLGPFDQGLSRRYIIDACEASLRRLRVDAIDLYQVHMQDTSVPIDETVRVLDDLVHQGKIRYFGCSNYTGYRLVESLWGADKRNLLRYESVQLQYSLICRDAERELIPAAKAFRLGVLAWSPLGRGFLTGKYKRDQAPGYGTRLETWKDSWKLMATPRNFDILDVVTELASKHETTPSAVAIAWAMSKPWMTSIIIGARTLTQLEDNLRALTVKLSAEEITRLDDVSKPAYGYPYDFIAGRQEW